MQTIHTRLQGLSILIVEDESSTRKWLVRVLQLYFKEVYSASDAMEALEKFTESPSQIVVADIQMPDVDGLTFLEKIAALSPNSLRIVMTAFNTNPYLNRAVEAGIHFYLKKPIDIDEFLVAVASHFPEDAGPSFINDLGRGFFYNAHEMMLYQNEKAIKLTKKELQFIELLLKNRHGITSFEQIEKVIWDGYTTPDAIRMVVVALRKKIYPELIENFKGLGYRLSVS
ncbi:response regulator transcription factor [Sulfuricurvum sp.]|uniref:response regulator transcription factor n=1 Tax=Sulfuricurvum sp. TaxID=2025608 RepID=UPI002622E2B2|nr:response regulator transcription factor [Sulfuricurvum sp.]MDD3596065.1 response regulator transcription factor [Sulfuricurvum sp.]